MYSNDIKSNDNKKKICHMITSIHNEIFKKKKNSRPPSRQTTGRPLYCVKSFYTVFSIEILHDIMDTMHVFISEIKSREEFEK